MDAFSMKELRQELDKLGTDYSSCIEKSELYDLLARSRPKSTKPKSKSEGLPKKLSIKSIKERLSALGVDYSACIEISELVELLVSTEQGLNATRPEIPIENQAASSASGRRASGGLRDITERMNAKANRQAPAAPKGEPASAPSAMTQAVDARDAGNVQAVPEYVRDIYAHLRAEEASWMPKDYLDSEDAVISTGQRGGVVDWIVDMHSRLRMQPATLFLAVNVLDRYLAGLETPPANITVVACACLLIAAKIEEIYPPKVRDIRKTVPSISATELTRAERAVLNQLKFCVSVPTVFHFIKRLVRVAQADQQLKALTMYIVELAVYDPVCMRHKPSLLASAGLSLALRMLGKPGWNTSLQHESMYGTADLTECVGALNGILGSAVAAPVQNSVLAKYQKPKYLEVAKLDLISAAV